MSERPTCSTCPYFDVTDDLDGACHRYPPTLPSMEAQVRESNSLTGKSDGFLQGWFPIVAIGDWCGEHPDFTEWLKARKPE